MPDHRIENVNNVPGVPAVVKRLEQTNTVGSGVVEQQVAQRSQHGAEIEIAPARGKPGRRPRRTGSGEPFARPKTVQQKHDAKHGCRDEWHAHETVRDPAMMLQSGDRSAKLPQHIGVGGFSGQHHGYRSQGGLPIEAGASHTGAGQHVSQRIQVSLRYDQLPQESYCTQSAKSAGATGHEEGS